jgi:hypothetical protein
MKALARLLIVSCLASFFAALAYGQSRITTLSCTSAQGSTLSAPVYYFDVTAALNYGTPNYFFLQLDLSTYETLASPTAPASYSTCSIGSAAASLSLSNVTVSSVGAGAGVLSTQPDVYTIVVLNFGSMTYTGTPSVDGQSPLGTFSCQVGDGSAFTAPVLAYELTYTTNSVGNINMDFSYLSRLISALSSGTSNCALSVAGTAILIPYFYIDNVDAIGSGAGVSTPNLQLTASIGWDQGSTDVATGAPDYSGLSPVATLTCQSGPGSTFTTPVYYFSLSPQADGFLNVDLDISQLAPLNADANAGVAYSTCVLDDGVVPITLSNASQFGPLVTGYGGPGSALPQLYASTSLYYRSLTVGSVTVSGTATSPGDHLRAPRARP